MSNCIGKHCKYFERSEKYALNVYCNFVNKKSLERITACSIAEEIKHQLQLDILENLVVLNKYIYLGLNNVVSDKEALKNGNV